MSQMTLLEIARQRRIDALASLKKREDNLFSLAEYRIRARARAQAPVAVFRSARAANDTLFAPVLIAASTTAPVLIAPAAPDDRLAA